MLKSIKYVCILLLILLSARILYGNGSIYEVAKIKVKIRQQQDKIFALQQVNEELLAEINLLKKEKTAIEEQARNELGMIKKGETYLQVVEPIE